MGHHERCCPETPVILPPLELSSSPVILIGSLVGSTSLQLVVARVPISSVNRTHRPHWMHLSRSRVTYLLSGNALSILLDRLRELKKHLIEYKHEVELREKEKAAKLRETIFSTATDVVKLIRAALGL